jgi:hypothetical protein
MSQATENATVSLYPRQSANLRWFALWYFTLLLVVWNIAGHTFLGFEQSWAHLFVGLIAACLTQIFLEWVDARATGRTPRFAGGVRTFVNFLPPPMISGMACAMLLYPNERLLPIAFAAVLAIASKVLVRIHLPNGKRTHVLNPSNIGIVATLFLFPAVGQAPPYHFTENITGVWHWVLPAAIIVTGIYVHAKATGRLILCLAWLVGFFLQGVFRAWLAGDYWFVPLTPMSSAGFILFTLYMIPDPATTPIAKGHQVLFGGSVAIAYAFFQMNHIVYGLFLALTVVCVIRGLLITLALRPEQSMQSESNKEQTVVRSPAMSSRPERKRPPQTAGVN